MIQAVFVHCMVTECKYNQEGYCGRSEITLYDAAHTESSGGCNEGYEYKYEKEEIK